VGIVFALSYFDNTFKAGKTAMKKISPNPAIIGNNIHEASKFVDLNHYDIGTALQTTLEFNKLIPIFSSKIESMIHHSAFVYTNAEFGVEIKSGVFTQHSCTYALKFEEQPLGELKLMRNHRFDDAELKLLEDLLCCLIYPLKNAILYHQALKTAYIDPLTESNKRASFNDFVRREMSLAVRHAKSLSIIFLEVKSVSDHFNAINDRQGHECSDIALTVVTRIEENLRSSDTVFRVGDEEFVILLNSTDIAGAEVLAERIRRAIEFDTLAYDKATTKITASLGVGALRADDTVDTFIRRAGNAMCKAKKSGRNEVMLAC
jgi:diguanylate cyclase (GGDEF)-like protein